MFVSEEVSVVYNIVEL